MAPCAWGVHNNDSINGSNPIVSVDQALGNAQLKELKQAYLRERHPWQNEKMNQLSKPSPVYMPPSPSPRPYTINQN